MKKTLVLIVSMFILTSCTNLLYVHDVNRQHKNKIQKLFRCGFYMCTNITICPKTECQTVKLIIDTGSAGLRINRNELSERVLNDLEDNSKKFGTLKITENFYNFKISGFYTTTNFEFVQQQYKHFPTDIYNTDFKHRILWKFLCQCDGLLGISNVRPINQAQILNMKNIKKEQIVTRKEFIKYVFMSEKTIIINNFPKTQDLLMKSPLLFQDYTIYFGKNTGYLKIGVERPENKYTHKQFKKIIDSGSPYDFYNKKDIQKVLGFNDSICKRTVYFYLNGTGIKETNTIYYPNTPKKD